MSPHVEKEVVVNAGRTTQVEIRVRPLGGLGGSVENISTDSLLKGVRIQLLDTNGDVVQETVTGDDGTYKFPGVSSGTYTVRMVLPKGYLAQGEEEKLVEVGGGDVRVDFQVFRHGAVEGRVVTEDGKPVADAEVELVDSGGTIVRTGRTDASGIYSFREVPVDKYKVRVAVPDEFEA